MDEPTRVFVLRHGQTAWNASRRIQGHVDEPLDDTGRWLLCSTHGAAYEPSSGRCVAGPCGRGRLTTLHVEERDGGVYWYPSRDTRPLSFSEPPGTKESTA